MDRSNDGAYGRTQSTSCGRVLEDKRTSYEPSPPRAPTSSAVAPAGPPPQRSLPLAPPPPPPPSILRPTAPLPPETEPGSGSGSRLQKKKSNAGVRNHVRGATGSAPIATTTATPQNHVGTSTRVYSTGGGGLRSEGKARTGSIRSAMRRMFGRRSRDVETDGSAQVTSPRHAPHKSEPLALSPPQEVAEPEVFGPEQRAVFHQRSFSRPYQSANIPQNISRNGSSYAVQFPKSASLKPLDLGNPFPAPNRSLRRRKTLPNVILTEGGADDAPPLLSAPPDSTDAPPIPPAVPKRELASDNISRGTGSLKSWKRRSRSTDDLVGTSIAESKSSRKKSAEIRYWRESYQGSVLRASGFRRKSPVDEGIEMGRDDDRTPMDDKSQMMGNVGDSYQEAGPASQYGIAEDDTGYSRGQIVSDGDASRVGTELSRDLEDRVAKLEAGLLHFQRSLQRITIERSPGNLNARSGPSGIRTSAEGRTPSMLADTLQDPLEPSSYQYDFRNTLRPSTSPHPPTTSGQQFDDPFMTSPEYYYWSFPAPLGSTMTSQYQQLQQQNTSTTHPSFRTAQQPPTPLREAEPPQPSSSSQPNQNQQQLPSHTFQSLYQMLSDERSARRRIEGQLQHLQREISDLHTQVAFSSSHIQSQRTSYIPTDPIAGSMRLHELLRDTEMSPPSSSHHERSGSQNRQQQQQQQFRQQQQQYHNFYSGSYRGGGGRGGSGERGPQVISRFSGSESETTGEDDLPTPYDAYQTPREEAGRWDEADDIF